MTSRKIRNVVLLVFDLGLIISGIAQLLDWIVITLPPTVYLVLGIGMLIYALLQAT